MKLPEAPRLRFATLKPADAPFILKLVNEPGWLQYVGDRNIHDLVAAAAYISKGPAASHAEHGFGLDLVSLADTSEPVGICGLLQRDYLDAPDIGYAFSQAHAGRGFASEAAQAVVDHARQALGLQKLYALTSPDNLASMRVLEKCGFVFLKLLQSPADKSPSRLFQIVL